VLAGGGAGQGRSFTIDTLEILEGALMHRGTTHYFYEFEPRVRRHRPTTDECVNLRGAGGFTVMIPAVAVLRGGINAYY